jgi:hypothetical protein
VNAQSGPLAKAGPLARRGAPWDPDHRRWVAQEIARETEADVDRFEGRPLTGGVVAEYFAYHAAALVGLAKLVDSLLPADSSDQPPPEEGAPS